MNTMIKSATIFIIMFMLAAPSFAGLIDYNKRKKSTEAEVQAEAPSPVQIPAQSLTKQTPALNQFQGIVLTKNIRYKQIRVKNTLTGDEKVFIINDSKTLNLLAQQDEVQVNFLGNSKIAQSVKVMEEPDASTYNTSKKAKKKYW